MTKTELIKVRVTDSQKERFSKAALAWGVTLSEWILMVLEAESTSGGSKESVQKVKQQIEEITGEKIAVLPPRKPLSSTGWWKGNKWVEPK